MAAYSKARRLKLRRSARKPTKLTTGRPLLPSVEREPNGRLSRRKNSLNRRIRETESETKMAVIAARIKMGMSESIAGRQEAGSVLGRLHILFPDRVTYAHFQAGLRYGADYCRYYALSGIPYPSARAHDMTRIQGVGTDKPEAAGQARERILDLGEAIRKVDQSGRPIATTIRKVCILDEDTGMHLPHMVRFLAIGLDALVDFYGIDRKAKPEDLTNE